MKHKLFRLGLTVAMLAASVFTLWVLWVAWAVKLDQDEASMRGHVVANT